MNQSNTFEISYKNKKKTSGRKLALKKHISARQRNPLQIWLLISRRNHKNSQGKKHPEVTRKKQGSYGNTKTTNITARLHGLKWELKIQRTTAILHVLLTILDVIQIYSSSRTSLKVILDTKSYRY